MMSKLLKIGKSLRGRCNQLAVKGERRRAKSARACWLITECLNARPSEWQLSKRRKLGDKNIPVPAVLHRHGKSDISSARAGSPGAVETTGYRYAAFGEALVDQDLDIDALITHASLSVGIGRGGMSCSIASGHKETAHGNVLGFAQIICDRCCPRRIPYAT